MEHSNHIEDPFEYTSDIDETKNEPFNAEVGDLDGDLETAIKSDAIGNTLYSKSWLLKFFLNLATSRNIETLEKHFKKTGCHKEDLTECKAFFDPENILSDFDSLVAMSAEATVAEYLIDAQSGCLGMLTAEILPIQINEEQEGFAEIRSHFWRRQELCLVTLSNIVVHSDVLSKMIKDIFGTSSGNSSNNQNILVELVHLSFSCVLFGEHFGLEAEFTSVLVACFQFLRNLTYSLTILICENQDNVSDTNEDLEEDNEILAKQIEEAYSNPPQSSPDIDSPKNMKDLMKSSKEDSNLCSNDYNEDVNANPINLTLRYIATEILTVVSNPEVVQRFGVILASSCNEELLNKMSRLLSVLLELSSDIEFEGLSNAYGQLRFIYCLKEALMQTFTVSHDVKTAFVFIDFMGEILNQSSVSEAQYSKTLFLDENGQKDERLPIELCDLLTDITIEMNDLKNCSIVVKVLRFLWNPFIMSKHCKSFENIGSVLLNVKEQITDWDRIDLDDQVAYSSIVEGLSLFIQNYEMCNKTPENAQHIENRILRLVQKEQTKLNRIAQND